MAIDLVCKCGKKLKADEKYAGQRGKCPKCGAVFTIPVPDTLDILEVVEDEPPPPKAPAHPPVPAPEESPPRRDASADDDQLFDVDETDLGERESPQDAAVSRRDAPAARPMPPPVFKPQPPPAPSPSIPWAQSPTPPQGYAPSAEVPLEPEFASGFAELAAFGLAVEAQYTALELEAPGGQDKVLLVLTNRGLAVFRQCTTPHPFFRREYAIFTSDRFTFAKGTGSTAANFGLALGGLGTQGALRISDASGTVYCAVVEKEAIDVVLSRASSWWGGTAPGAAAPAPVFSPAPSPWGSQGVRLGAIEDSILSALRTFLPQDGLFVEPEIPPSKLANAAVACEVPPGERILGLIDCTVFGSAKNGILIGARGIYCHNDWSGKTPGAVAVPYSELPTRRFGDGGYLEVSLDRGQFVSVAGSSVSKETAIRILLAVRQVVCG